MVPAVLVCTECAKRSESAPGWRAFLAQDPDEDLEPVVVAFCPECARREFDDPLRDRGGADSALAGD
jgi:hypothetical protein